jgi:hypothetical protein
LASWAGRTRCVRPRGRSSSRARSRVVRRTGRPTQRRWAAPPSGGTDGSSSRAGDSSRRRSDPIRSRQRRRRMAPLGRQRADSGSGASVGLRRRSVRDPTRRRGYPSRDDATPGGSGEREKGRRRPRLGWRRRARRGRLPCGGSIRRMSGGRREEHRDVPWCAHHAPTESLPHPLPPAELKRKLRACANRPGAA